MEAADWAAGRVLSIAGRPRAKRAAMNRMMIPNGTDSPGIEIGALHLPLAVPRPARVRVEWAGAAFKTIERVGPYDANAVEPVPAADVTIPGGGIATLSNVEPMVLPADMGR